MGKKKGNKTNHRKSPHGNTSVWRKIAKPLFVLVLIIIAIIVISIQKNIGNKRIKNNNKITTGWVYDKGVGRRCNDIRHYYFFVNGKKYTGQSSSDENLNVDDKIKVVYNPEDPTINRSWNSYIKILKDD